MLAQVLGLIDKSVEESKKCRGTEGRIGGCRRGCTVEALSSRARDRSTRAWEIDLDLWLPEFKEDGGAMEIWTWATSFPFWGKETLERGSLPPTFLDKLAMYVCGKSLPCVYFIIVHPNLSWPNSSILELSNMKNRRIDYLRTLQCGFIEISWEVWVWLWVIGNQLVNPSCIKLELRVISFASY